MKEQRYNYELQVTAEDFTSSNYVEILNEASRDGYSGYWTILSKSAREEAKNGNEKVSKVLWLLSDACSMMLKPESLNEPFAPMVVMNGSRSALPEDFSEDEITFFESIVERCKNYKLQARIADVLWLLKEKKDFNHLKIALKAYSKFDLTYDKILIDSREGFERGIRLSLATKQPVGQYQKILLEYFYTSEFDHNFHCLWLNKLIYISKIDKSNYESIISKLEIFAKEFVSICNWRIGREYFKAIREWYIKLDDQVKMNETTVAIAETFVSEAEDRKDIQMVSAIFFGNAIQEYRSIPTHFREKLKVDEKLAELYQKMTHANKLSLTEMSIIKTEGVDISEFVEYSINAIQGQKIDAALVILSNISKNPILKQMKENAKNTLKSTPFYSLFGSTHLSFDGRVVSKRSGLSFGDGESKSYLQALDSEIIQGCNIDINLIIQANIMPAFLQLTSEHRIHRQYLIDLCSNSSIVPRSRMNIWAEGLYFGFEQNFLVSTHLLIPQVENLIRVLLKQIPVQTTVLDPNGIEIEKGLSTLLEDKRLVEVMDENLIFLFKFLLTSQEGHNLRNDVAHGLSEGNFNTIHTVYLWWLCLRLVVNNSTLISNEVKAGDIDE